MNISGDWIKAEGLQTVLALLTRKGYCAYLVGGCVRNALIGEPIADVDIATDALPEKVAELATEARLRIVPTGIEHGTVTVIVQGVGYEITTFRRDVETDGRRATIAYASDIKDDAARRDFTMNALYADADGRVVDPLGGLPDLLARRVRFVGDAEARIREDYLRILRFFRFHAWYGDSLAGMDPDALAACAANSDGIAQLSRERIGHEMRRLLAAPDPVAAVAAMQVSGILGRVIPGADSRALGPLVHLETPLGPNWLRRLAALGGTNLAEALRLSAAEAKRLNNLNEGVEGTKSASELAYRLGSDTAQDIVLLRSAKLETPLPPAWHEAIETGARARFPVKAADLMPDLSGPELGVKLAELESRWIASGFELSREQLLS
jgi:poly(A) polymerase